MVQIHAPLSGFCGGTPGPGATDPSGPVGPLGARPARAGRFAGRPAPGRLARRRERGRIPDPLAKVLDPRTDGSDPSIRFLEVPALVSVEVPGHRERRPPLAEAAVDEDGAARGPGLVDRVGHPVEILSVRPLRSPVVDRNVEVRRVARLVSVIPDADPSAFEAEGLLPPSHEQAGNDLRGQGPPTVRSLRPQVPGGGHPAPERCRDYRFSPAHGRTLGVPGPDLRESFYPEGQVGNGGSTRR